MKKILKIVLGIVAINSIIGLGIIGFVSGSVVNKSVNDTNIDIFDLLKSDTSQEDNEQLKENILNNSSDMGHNCADKIKGVLSNFIPKVDYSQMPEIPYPYEEDISDKIQAASDEGLQEGLKLLDETSQH
ncbi:hypothetical protein [Clostridium butyricum]|uniref:hypothetical protein n=1 Tax=Clostridium butyricum TaxID=1492 RepID=UPI00374F812B